MTIAPIKNGASEIVPETFKEFVKIVNPRKNVIVNDPYVNIAENQQQYAGESFAVIWSTVKPLENYWFENLMSL